MFEERRRSRLVIEGVREGNVGTLFEDGLQRVGTKMVGRNYGTDGVSSRLGEWRGAVNLVLKRERVTTGGKGRGECFILCLQGWSENSRPSLCETRDKRPLNRESDRSWCHHHTTSMIKLSWSQAMAPFTTYSI